MSASNDNVPGAKAKAIRDLTDWLQSSQTSVALEAIELLELTDMDIESLFELYLPSSTKLIPHLGKVT